MGGEALAVFLAPGAGIADAEPQAVFQVEQLGLACKGKGLLDRVGDQQDMAARAAGLRKGRSKFRTAEGLDAALAAVGSRPHAPLARYDDHSTDAILASAWLRANADRAELWSPAGLTPEVARTEGWTFGVA